MRIIGVTGGVGSGKSTVLDYLEKEKQARVYRLDDVARALQEPGGRLYPSMVTLFGRSCVNPDGSLDRRAIAAIIYKDDVLKKQLTDLVHPAVRKYMSEAIEKGRREGIPLLVIESALLLDDNYSEICDELWYIYAVMTVRRQRLKASRGYTDELIDDICRQQKSEEAFRDAVDFVVDNSGSFDMTKPQIDKRLELWGEK